MKLSYGLLYASCFLITIIIVIASFNRIFYPTYAQLDAYMNAWSKTGKFSGSVLVSKNGKILFSRGCGMANYEHQVFNTPKTKFHIGSITKPFTALAIMQLVQVGKLKLDDTIARLLPNFPRGNHITVRQLLAHTAGIANYTDFPDFDPKKPATIADLIAQFKAKPFDFKPGSKATYSNSGFVLLAAIIEKLSGQSYETFLQEHILNPANMHDSGLLHNKPLIMHRAQGYSKTVTGIENAPVYEPGVIIGAGGLYATVEDLYRWDCALRTEKILKQTLQAEMYKLVCDDHGLGWFITSIYGHRVVWYAGGYYDCSAMIKRFIDDNVCIIVVSNFGFSAPPATIADGLAAIIFNKPYVLPGRAATRVNPNIYDDYLGTYELKPGTSITIIKQGVSLYAQPTNKPAFELLAESATSFFNDEHGIDITFVKDAKTGITHLIQKKRGVTSLAKKINSKACSNDKHVQK